MSHSFSRFTLTLSSINPVTLSPSALQTYYQCSPRVQRLEKSTLGATMRRTKTLRKARRSRTTAVMLLNQNNWIDATTLDTWVLDQLRTLFQNASSNDSLDSELRADKVVFFLHLLGLDTTGHSYRPHSKVSLSINVLLLIYSVAGIHEKYSSRRPHRPTNRRTFRRLLPR